MRRAALAISILGLAGCHTEEPEKGELAAVSVEPEKVEPLSVGPVSFFNDACARCHGESGWGYEPGFTSNYTRDELKEVVHEMVVGPSQRALGERELEALTDLHYAIDAGESGRFAAAIADGQRDELSGSESLELDLGAWKAVGPSGRVFGEKDSGE